MLCWFLSRLMPEKEAGGRQGLAVYKNLLACAEVMPKEYKWAKRHTAESWKQRYKMYKDLFDTRIEVMVEKDPPRLEQRWPQDRRVTNAAIKKRGLNYDSDDSAEERQPIRRRNAEPEDEEDEEEEEVEIVEVSRKRRSPNYSPEQFVHPKRRRLPHRTDQRQEQISHTPRTSKGKEKAAEIEDEERAETQRSEYDSLFDEELGFERLPEPGSSFRSPDRTLVASSRPNQAQGIVIQTTPRNDAQMSVSRTRDGPSNGAFQPINNPDWLSPPMHSSPQKPIQTSMQSLGLDVSQPPSLPATQRPSSIYQLPKKAARRRPPAAAPPIEEGSAPYRNTRQRSRSVEPLPQVSQKPRKEKKQASPIPEELDDEVEVVQPVRPIRSSSRLRSVEPPQLPPLPQPGRNARKKRVEAIPEEIVNQNKPLSETLVDEMDVANLLTQDAPNRSVYKLNSRGISMDTDDAQIDRRLRAGFASSQVGPPAKFNFLDQPPSEILKRVESSSSRRHSLLLSLSNHPSAMRSQHRSSQFSIRKPRQSAPSRLRNDDTPDPLTPARQEIDRGSSLESFPLSGTRARLLKEEMTQREKTTPYRPPAGTRAAQLSRPS
ncbi:hypothetical protein BDN70DRAFT_85134 [Pholiota conissans]|uniref:Rap1 Myb domain-containing protein n=1 Tax=Pholiota conissans TaxID=109636 RepID=A0A9P6D6A2_9AGAR|nr:hypothetical protein BDN70DRAFT_85134 [Pholiota conissans]